MSNNGEKSFGKWIGEHRVVSGLAVVVLGLGALGVSNYVSVQDQTDRQPVPAGSCESPFFSTTHKGDPEAASFSQFFGGRSGVVLHVSTGDQNVRGVRAAFRAPDDAEWVATSAMLPVDDQGEATLTLAIGNGGVEFGVQTIAQEGASACDVPPAVVVDEQSTGVYRNRPGQSPWPNPGEYLTNLHIWVPPV